MRDSGSLRRERLRATSVLTGILIGLAFVLFIPAWIDPFHRVVGGGGDPIQSMWFLKWMPYAVTHGTNPLWTDYINAPTGVNLMWDSLAPVVSLLMWPVTATLGPVFAYNLFITLAIGLSGVAAYWAARNILDSTFAAFICAVAYEFSPFVTVQAQAHAKVSFIFLPPLLLGCLDRAIRQQRWPARRLGLTIGAAFVVQMFIFPEGVALATIATAVGLLVLALLHLRQTAAVIRRLWPAIPWALLVFVPLVAGPLAFQFLGPNRLAGSVGGSNVYVTDLTNLFLPTNAQAISPSFATATTANYTGNIGEANSYLSVFVLLLFPITTWIGRTNRFVIWASPTCAVLILLSLGPQLHFAGHLLNIPLPWTLIAKIPVLNNAYPSRLFVYVDLLIALEIGIFAAAMAARWRRGQRLLAVPAGLLLLGVAAAYFPAQPYFSSTVTVPPAFTNGKVASVISAGSSILVVPFTQNSYDDNAMLWQASSDFAFRMPEGYFIDYRFGDRWDGPGPSTYSLVLQAIEGGSQSVVSVGQRELIDTELRAGGVAGVLVGPMPHRDIVEQLMTAIYGTPQYDDGQVAVWKAHS